MRIPSARVTATATVIALSSIAYGQTTEFSQAHATEFLRVLALDIGPRPMGSPAERLALEFAVKKLTEFGCDTAYVIPMVKTRGQFRGQINTRSGIAVGILNGATGRVIVLGAHIDSAGPEIPGANDDGSGTAVILELARVLAEREWQSTLAFAFFGGEEMGLRGSELFIDEFPAIDSVAMMIQVDMADASPKLLLLADTHDHNAPAWLVRAAFEESAWLGHDGLTYETYFNTFSSLFPRPIASSDHETFLRKGIPAIDFSSDIATPIHTPQDEFARIRPEGLKRSGDLVYRLVERFDRGVPGPARERYWLYQVADRLVFIQPWLLWTFIGISVGTAVASLVSLRKRSVPLSQEQEIRFSGGKLFVALLVIMAFVTGSELLLGLLKGWRHPWFFEPGLYRILAVLFGLLGLWMAIRIAQRLKLSPRIDAYLVRSIVPLAILIVLFSLASVYVAFTVATALFMVSLAFLVRNPIVRALLWMASPYLLMRLWFNEEVDFMARLSATIGTGGFWRDVGTYGFLVIGSTVLAFPFLTSFVGIYKDSGRDLLFVSRFKEKHVGIVLALIVIGYTVYLIPRPTYTDTWRREVRVEQEIDLARDTSSTWLRSSEYLRDVRITLSDGDTLLDGWNFRYNVQRKGPTATKWLQWERHATVQEDTMVRRYDLELRMHFVQRPYRLEVSYVSDSASFHDVRTPLAYTAGAKRLNFSWYSFPDTIVTLPVSLRLSAADSLRETITATFTGLASPLQLEASNTNFIYRTTVRSSQRIGSP